MLPWILAFALSSAPMQESDPATLLPPTASPDYSAEIKQITGQIAKQYEAWSAHDIDGYMAPFWKSPQLRVCVTRQRGSCI